jgi:quercetin dioxygenase-like cupin family protein
MSAFRWKHGRPRRTHGATWVRVAIVASVAAAVMLSALGGIAVATPPSGLSATPLGVGELANAVRVKLKDDEGFGDGVAVKRIQMTRFELAPGGTFGWHQHGGPVWVVVVQGTLTLYSGDEGCTATTVGTGGAFLDHGNDTHSAVNLGDQTVVVYATFMLPAGGAARVDVPDPEVCS